MSGNSMRPGDFKRYIARVSGAPAGHPGESSAAKDIFRQRLEQQSHQRQERRERQEDLNEQRRAEARRIWEESAVSVTNTEEEKGE